MFVDVLEGFLRDFRGRSTGLALSGCCQMQNGPVGIVTGLRARCVTEQRELTQISSRRGILCETAILATKRLNRGLRLYDWT